MLVLKKCFSRPLYSHSFLFMSVFINYSPLLALLYGIIIFSYLIGHFLLAYFVENTLKNITSFFVKTLVGITSLLTCVAIWQTKGLTFNILFIVIAIFVYFFYKNQKNIANTTNTQIVYKPFIELNFFAYLVFFLVPLILYSLRILATYNWQIQNLATHWGMIDHAIYIRFAENLRFGIENKAGIFNQWQPTGREPYHYYDLWFIYFFSRQTNFLTAQVYELVAFPFFNFLSFVGYLALGEVLWHKQSKKYLFLGAILTALWFYADFVSVDFFMQSKARGFFNNSLYFNNLYVLKLPILKCFFALFLLTWLSGKRLLACYVLLCLPIANIITAPAIFGGLGLYVLISFRYNWLSRKEIYHLVAAMGSFVVLLVGLLLIGKQPNIQTEGLVTVKTVIENIVHSPQMAFAFLDDHFLRYLLLYFPLVFIAILALFYAKKAQNISKIANTGNHNHMVSLQFTNFIYLAIFMLFAGLGTTILIENLVDSYQIFKIISFIVIEASIFLALVIGFQTANSPKIQYGFIVFCLMISLIGFKNIISRDIGFSNLLKVLKNEPIPTHLTTNGYITFLDSVKIQLQKLENSQAGFNKLGIFLSDSSNYSQDLHIYEDIYKGYSSYLTYIGNDYTILTASFYKIQHLAKRTATKQQIKKNFFEQFVAKQKAEKKFSNYSKSLADFVKAYQVRYAVATKEAEIESDLQKMVATIITNPENGERFIVFRAF
jgi:hypothetical protein